MTFLQKTYGAYSNVEKPVLVTTRNEGLDDDEELKIIPVVNQNNNHYNVVSNSDSKSNDKETEKNIFDDNNNKKVEATHKTNINAESVRAMKKIASFM